MRDWCPPVLLRWLREIICRREIVFEGDFSTWNEASARCSGYDTQEILTKVLDATLKVSRGEAAFERDSVLFKKIEYEWPVLSGLMLGAARNDGKLNVLDFGGALGSSFFQNRYFLKTLREVRWSVVEQAHYVEAGQLYLHNEQLRFYKSIDNCFTENKPNVILLSSVLQYLPEPRSTLLSICNAGADIIIIDRTIVNNSYSDRAYVQHVPPSIYLASYPCWSLSEHSLLSIAIDKYEVIGSFKSLPFPALSFIDSEFKGYILKRILQ